MGLGAAVLTALVALALGPRAEATVANDPDAERRARLEARLLEARRAGDIAALVDAPARAAPRRRALTPRPSRPVEAPSAEAASPADPAPLTFTVLGEAPAASGTDASASTTFTPPAYRGGAAPPRGRGYVEPRLDLTTPPLVPTDPVECLTQAIYYEARTESDEGQAAVAEVVLNRSRSGLYPSDVCQVVYQRNSRTCQFTFTCDGAIGRSPVNMGAWARAERIAREVYDGRAVTLLPSNALNYHATYVAPSWGRRLQRVRQIGAHIFYGAPLDYRAPPGATDTAAPSRGGVVFARNAALDEAYARAMSESD